MEKTFGKYTLVERLGGGGMAEVFKARLTGPAGFEKHLALKLILPHYCEEPEFVQMFIHEANLAARLDHANIVRIHEFDQVEKRYYIAMELVDGRDLRWALAQSKKAQRPFSVPEALLIAVEVCRGLAFAHGELTPGAPEIIHRDISPHNLILSRAGEVKITDFGIAKLASTAGSTLTGTVKGKLAYMSPEQSRAEILDGRTDIFSAGCVLWEMLTGRRLFAGENEAATLEKLKSAPIEAPSRYNPRVPPALDQVVLAALARDVEQRLAKASDFERRLEQVLADIPDLDRTATLFGLFKDLFSVQPPKADTAVMKPGLSKEQAESHHTGPGSSVPGGEPVINGSDHRRVSSETPESEDLVKPVGPDAPTSLKQLSDDPPGRGVMLRWWMILAFVSPLLAAFAVVMVMSLSPKGEGPDALPVSHEVSPPESDGSADLEPQPEAADAGVPPGNTEQDQPAAGSPDGEAAQKQDDAPPDAGLATGADGPPIPDPQFQTGRLKLNAIPWAQVYRGRKLLGSTPLERKRMPVGVHTFTLVNDDLGVRRKVRVRINPGRLTTEVFQLKGKP